MKYYLLSGGRHDIHSPFVYEFLENVILDTKKYPDFEKIEKLKRVLLKDDRIIQIKDLGAGSLVNSGIRRPIRIIAKNSGKSVKFGRLFFRIVQHFRMNNVLEIGTSLGISTAYLASPKSITKIVTLEGCPETAKVAQENFHQLDLPQIQVITGDFRETLLPILDEFPVIDLVFFDGNHQSQPTLSYFQACLKKASSGSIFIFDDIHWTQDMEMAWDEIKRDPAVTLTLDLFFIGLVFFRKEIKKPQHFVLRF
ncbi:MAG: O-methyltransferase [Chitinophagaceae bacterium]